MSVAKRTLFVTKEKLAEVFGLPEGVEIMIANESKTFEEGVEFILVSPDEVEINGHKVTVKTDNKYSLTRRITLDTLEKLNNGEEPYATGGYISINTTPPQINIIHNNELDTDTDKLIKKISKEIEKGIKKRTDGDLK